MSLPSDLSERAVTAADIPGVVALVARCDATYEEWAGAWTQPGSQRETERWRELLARHDHWARAAFGTGGPTGVVAWRQAETEKGGRVPGVAHVTAVFTDPSRWGEGIARHLLAAGLEEARRRGLHTARLWTPRDAPARGFYIKQGWALDGRAKWEPAFDLHLVGFEKRLV